MVRQPRRHVLLALGACLALPFLAAPPARAEVLLERAVVITGEWYPFTSEELADSGVLASLVTRALKAMGRLPDYQFLPFSRALETTRGGDAIGTFPWFHTAGREADFLYSEPILQVEYVIYYSRDADTDIAGVTAFDDLADFSTVRVAGYAYGKLDCLIEGQEGPDCTTDAAAPDRAPSEYRALRMLADGEVDYVAASRNVAQAIIARSFGFEDRRKFAILEGAPFAWEMGVHFLIPHSRRDSEDLMRQFDRALAELADEGRVAEVREQLDGFAYADDGFVRLVASGGSPVIAELSDGRRIALPAGTRAVVLEWSDVFVGLGATSGDTTLVRLVNGPLRGEIARVDDRAIELE